METDLENACLASVNKTGSDVICRHQLSEKQTAVTEKQAEIEARMTFWGGRRRADETHERSTAQWSRKIQFLGIKVEESSRETENNLQSYLLAISKRIKVGPNISYSRKHFITDT